MFCSSDATHFPKSLSPDLFIFIFVQVQLQSVFTPDMRFIFLIPSVIVVRKPLSNAMDPSELQAINVSSV